MRAEALSAIRSSFALLVFAAAPIGCGKTVPAPVVDAGATEPVASSGEPPSAELPSSLPSAGSCDGGGGTDTDIFSAGNFPRILRAGEGEYCLDPAFAARAYGDQASAPLDAVCASELHAECDLYKSFGLQRFVTVRYVDATVGGGLVSVKLSRFADRDAAFAMLTRRVVPEDPADPHAPKPIDSAGVAAVGLTRAYVWRADSLAELEYTNSAGPSQPAGASAPSAVLSEVARLLSLNLRVRGPEEKPPSVTRLPTAHLAAPLAISYFPKDVLGVASAGAGAVGYYREGDTRYRLVAIQTAGTDKAKQVMKAFGVVAGAAPFVGLGAANVDEAIQVSLPSSSPNGPKVSWWLARTKDLVVGAGDDDLPLDARNAPAGPEPARLTTADAIEVIRAWIAPRRAPKPGPKR